MKIFLLTRQKYVLNLGIVFDCRPNLSLALRLEI